MSENGETPSARQTAVTEAQKLREKRLRDDPYCKVISPTVVICRRCDATIKLSTKSTYDNFHWQNHRERCLKRSSAQKKPQGSNQTKAQTPISPTKPPTGQAEAIKDYIIRSHPKISSVNRPNTSDWKTWSWKQLNFPQFATGTNHGKAPDIDDESDM